MVKFMKAIFCPLKLYSVAVRVFFPDTELRLPQLLFKYDIECMVCWLRRSETHLTFQVAALVSCLVRSFHWSVMIKSRSGKTGILDTFWAAAPKGTKSCRTQGDFCLSVCPLVRSLVRLSVPPPVRVRDV